MWFLLLNGVYSAVSLNWKDLLLRWLFYGGWKLPNDYSFLFHFFFSFIFHRNKKKCNHGRRLPIFLLYFCSKQEKNYFYFIIHISQKKFLISSFAALEKKKIFEKEKNFFLAWPKTAKWQPSTQGFINTSSFRMNDNLQTGNRESNNRNSKWKLWRQKGSKESFFHHNF